MNAELEAFWERYAIRRHQGHMGRRDHRRRTMPLCSGAIRLSPDPEENNYLLTETLEDGRRAVIATLTTLQRWGRPIMGSNEYFIITDNDGAPWAVIRTAGAHFLPFRSMTADLAMMEGIDASFHAWQTRWRAQIQEEARAMGMAVSMDVMMVTETYELVYQE